MAYTTIDKPEDYFNTITWTGDGSRPISITGVGFQPDMVWAKNRSPDAFEHKLYDSSRGAGSDKELTPNENYAEGGSNADTYGYLSSFDSDGFSSTDSNYNAYFNKSGTTYVAWNWKANAGSTSSNTSGTITSTVQANTDAGFSIGTYTGVGGTSTIGHGLNVAPEFFIIKRRDTAADWLVHPTIIDGSLDYFWLNKTDAASNAGEPLPTSSVFTVPNVAWANASGGTYVFYAFHSVQGYSKFGKYVGNGNANGTFVYTGFAPAFVMIKKTSGTSAWIMYDNKRNSYTGNYIHYLLQANYSDAEVTNLSYPIDFLSNGFKLRGSSLTNDSGGSYIYIAFAENPFVTSTGIPTTAR